MKKVARILGFICPRVTLNDDSDAPITKYNQSDRLKNDPHVFQGVVPGSARVILNAMD